ncbi:hypothetical protein INR49_021530 [Caranx melampygus]|nr:hypothetical protein INR49_021530 [Caranx melampygus]
MGVGTGWDCLYLFLCLCYSCGLPESGDRENYNTIHLFEFMFTSPSLFGIISNCKLIDVLELESVQRDRLVKNRESASFLQQLVQLQILWQPEGILFWTNGPLH